MRSSKTVTIVMFIGILLILVFAAGLVLENNPGAFRAKYRYDFALEQFCGFCKRFWLPAGIIGIPTFLITMFISFRQEKRDE